MMTSVIPKQHQSAAEQVDRFVQRFESSYRRLAFYAALPLVLTPELVHYLRSQFLLKDGVPWVAEVDLLLSDICNPVGYEQYAIEPRVRAYLLSGMEEEIGLEQMQAVARLLLSYVQQLARANPETLRHQELELQQWAAMVYLDDQRESVVQRLAAAYQACVESGKMNAESAGKLKLDLDRLTHITQELAPQLLAYPELLKYANLLRKLLDEQQVAPELLQQHFEVAPGIELTVPPVLIGGVETEDGFWQWARFEVKTIKFSDELQLQPYKFEVTTLRFTEEVLEIEDVFRIANGAMQARTREKLNALQEEIIDGTWQQKSYAEIADREGLSVSHVSRAGAMLFRGLSEELGKSITKKNMVEVFGKIVGKSVRVGYEIVRVPGHAEKFAESLGNGVELEMVRIPAGDFMMGSPQQESERYDDESPQHLVTVPEFYFGKYPVTQAQWRVVADLPLVERELKREPSNFEGDDLPVEQVSWFEAIEFCRRLSVLTGREYRLPSEAEWEYACRAGTTTPFHFGEMISTDVANYNGDYVYGIGEKGIYREKTTPVGSFNAANNFGLHDMHGNVLEWVLDHYHSDYEGVPIDGSAFIDPNAERNAYRGLRGGSWNFNPQSCRSACRGFNYFPDDLNNVIGFRVVCEAARTP
jgi:formylglycine-generating enzyme required for sulfatase activity